jgi:hypothetical protein
MFDTRRRFLASLAATGALGALFNSRLRGQSRPTSGRPPAGTGAPTDPDANPDNPEAVPAKSPSKAMLEANEKDIKKNIEKLYQLAADLKTEVEKTDSSQVLSLALLKKADEIEKLAHDIKTRAKG